MAKWYVLCLLFLVMDSPWQTVAHAVPEGDQSLSKDIIIISNNTPELAKRTREWADQMLSSKDSTKKPQSPHVFVLDEALLSQLRTFEWNNVSSWFRFERDNVTMAEEDMFALRVVYVSMLLFTILAAGLMSSRMTPIRIGTLCVFGLTLVLFVTMYVIAYKKGLLTKTRFNISRVVARSPGSIFGVAIAMIWLTFPILELFRSNANKGLTIARFIIASAISLLLALITFVPETGETIPHVVVACLLIIFMLIQTVLIFVTETTSKFLRIFPVVLLSAEAATTLISMVPNLPVDPYLFLGVGQLMFLTTLLILWIVAAFLPYTKALGREHMADDTSVLQLAKVPSS